MSKVCLFSTILTVIICIGSASAQNQEVSADTIIKKMAERYKSLTSYQDVGVVEEVSRKPIPLRKTEVFFKTYFSRPKKIRFEWSNLSDVFLPDANITWSDGLKTHTYSSYNSELETEENIGMAIAGATGVSRGAAHTIPELLLSEVDGFSLTHLQKPSLKGEEVFEGELCFVIQGYHPGGELYQLWIGKNDFLVRKTRSKALYAEFEEQIHRDIKVNVAIPDDIYQIKIENNRVLYPISKEKEANIKRLLEMTLPRERLNQEIQSAIDMLKSLMPKVPANVWTEVIAEVGFDSDTMIKMFAPVYDKYYSDEEVKQMLLFYDTPIGKKILRNQVFVEMEVIKRSEKMGEEIIKRLLEKLKTKGYTPQSA